MRISILTSSRADYGIYLPLLKKLKDDPFFDLNIIAFGTHLSENHGFTISDILTEGFELEYQIKTVLGDTPKEISLSMALTINEFSKIWDIEKEKTNLIICLGDRYEMFAAVSASVPFSIPVAHIHGGETTLGAIDNVFRHSLTLMSKYHFTSTQAHAEKVKTFIDNEEGIYNVGSLSLDNLDSIKLLSLGEFKSKFGIDLSIPTILVTFHPETISFEKNEEYVRILSSVFKELTNFQIVITMPNADTMGNVIRREFESLGLKFNHIITIENFGIQGYFTAMRYSSFLLGNTSSGIIEAASFKKYVINLGNRQKGRIAGGNVIHTKIEKGVILQEIEKLTKLGDFEGENIYKGNSLASKQIIKVLKNI